MSGSLRNTEPRDADGLLSDEEMAEYVREHRCYNARRDVTLGDWDRGIRGIEADAILRSASRDSELREAIEALRNELTTWGTTYDTGEPRSRLASSRIPRSMVLYRLDAILGRSSEKGNR